MENKINPKEWEFEFQQRGGSPILMSDLWCQALYFRYPKEIGFEVTPLDYLITSEFKGYYKKGKRDEILEKFKSKVENDPSYLSYIFDMTKKRVEEFDAYMQSEEKDWRTFMDKAMNLVPWFWIPWYITEFNLLSDRVIKGLEGHVGEISKLTDPANAAMVLLFPDKKMDFQLEQELLYDLVRQTKEGKNIDVKDYIEHFGWMNTYFLVAAELRTETELKEKINRAITEKSDDLYKVQIERKANDQELAKLLEAIISNDRTLMNEIRNARYLAWLLSWSIEASMKAFARGIPWYKEIAQKIGLKYSDWVNLTIDEVARSLKAGSSVISPEEMQKRREAFVITLQNGKLDLISGEEAAKIVKSFAEQEKAGVQEDVKEIIGKSASAGLVKGRVKIVPTAAESNIVEEGDILVCGMTSPDYVPAMKKAGAIVTDEGGLLCHAAIISRELGKPCVIATKIATKVLKNGQEVEVNAGKGIVRILK